MALKKIPLQKNKKHNHGSYNYQCKIVHRDNKDICNYKRCGGFCGYRMRVPSLKRSTSTWKRFYKLYPRLLKWLKNNEEYFQTEGDGFIVERELRIHNNYYRSKTLKYKKTW